MTSRFANPAVQQYTHKAICDLPRSKPTHPRLGNNFVIVIRAEECCSMSIDAWDKGMKVENLSREDIKPSQLMCAG